MKQTLSIVAALVLAATVFNAPAKSVLDNSNKIAYDYIDLGYNNVSYSGGGSQGQIDLVGSFDLMDHINLVGAINYLPEKYGSTYYNVRIGGGYHISVIDNLDVFGSLALEYAHSEVQTICYVEGSGTTTFFGIPIPIGGTWEDCTKTGSDTGFMLRGGARYQITDAFSARGGVYHRSTYSGETGLFASAVYHFTDAMGIGAKFQTGDHRNWIGAYLRYNF